MTSLAQRFSRNDKSLSVVQGYWRLSVWKWSTSTLIDFVEKCIERGVNVVDHADIYGDYRCESLFGEALKEQPSLKDQISIITKCDIKLTSARYPERKINYYDTSAKHIRESVDNSLRRLNVERIDLLLIHRPDLLMDPFEMAEVFEMLREQGKVESFGVSNFSQAQYQALQSACGGFELATNQVELNPLRFDAFENGAVDQLLSRRLRPMAWSPLAGGRLFQPKTEQEHRVVMEVNQLSQESGASFDELCYAWLAAHPSRPIPIVGSSKIERVDAALRGMQHQLSREDWYRVWVASKGHPVP